MTRQFRIVVLLHWDAYEDVVEDLGNIKGGADKSSGVTEPSHGHAWLEDSFVRPEKGQFDHQPGHRGFYRTDK